MFYVLYVVGAGIREVDAKTLSPLKFTGKYFT